MATQQIKVVQLETAHEWRGGQQQIIYLYRSLLDKQLQTRLVCNRDSEIDRYCRRYDLPVHHISMKGEFDLAAAFRLALFSRKNGWNIIHAHSAHAAMIGILSKIFNPGIRVVVSRRVDFSVRKPFLGALKYNNHFVDKIICVSDRIRNILLTDGVPAQKLITIHSGIDLKRFERSKVMSQAIKAELGIPAHHKIVGTIAALAGHKDYPTLLHAARSIVDRYEDVTFCAVGDGSEKSSILALHSSLKLRERFKFTGFRKDVEDMLNIFDVFVLSSKYEGMGTSILDAQAAAVPVVATAAGGIPEIIEHGRNGLLVEPQNSQALANAIMHLLDDPKRRREMVKKGLEKVVQFGIERTVEKTINVYKQLMSDS